MAINVGNLVKSFMSATTAKGMEGRKALTSFIKDNKVKGFSTANFEERMHEGISGIPAAKITADSGSKIHSDFLAVPGAPNGEHYVLPNFQSYTNNYHVERGLGDMFDSNFRPGNVYDMGIVKNIVPGRGIVNADGTLKITQRGSIDFGNGHPIERQLGNSATGKYGNGSPERGPTTPEQQLAEELAANNAKLLEEAGQPVIEPSVRTPESPKSPTPETPVPPEEPVKTTTEPPVKEQPSIPPEQYDADEAAKLAEEDFLPKEEPSKTFIPDEYNVNAELAAKKEGFIASDIEPPVAEPAPVGSGQDIVDKYNSTKAAIRETDWWNNVSTGYNPNGNVNLNRNILAQHESLADNGRWGVEGRNAHFMDRVQEQLNATNSAINRDGTLKTLQEKSNAYQARQKEVIQNMLNEGPGISDFFFGNKLHHKLVGAGLLVGGANAAFGGHKSNAELYSSPY